MNCYIKCLRLLLAVIMSFGGLQLTAQDSTQSQHTGDTMTNRHEGRRMDSAGLAKRVDSVRRKVITNDTAIVNQINKMEEYANQVGMMSSFFSRGIDTTNIHHQLAEIERQLAFAGNGIYAQNRHPNLRNLVSTRILLLEMEKQLEKWRKKISAYNVELVSMHSMLDSMSRDSSLRMVPSDSLMAVQYANRLLDLVNRIRPLRNTLKNATIQIGLLQGRIVRSLLQVHDQLALIEKQINDIRDNFFSRDEPPIWLAQKKGFQSYDSVKVSWNKAGLLFQYYINGIIQFLLIAAFLLLVLWWGLSYMIIGLKRRFPDFNLNGVAPHLQRSVFYTSLFLSFSIAQLVLWQVPMLVLELIWVVMLVAITRLIWPDLNRNTKKLWALFSLLFFWALLENLMLENAAFERYLMVVATGVGIALAFYLLKVHKSVGRPVRHFPFFIWLFLIQEGLGFVGNIFGYFTFAKSMAVGGYFNFVLGLMFFHGVVLLNEITSLLYEYFRHKESVTSVINLSAARSKIEKFLPVLAWVAWGTIFAKNLNFYDEVVEAVISFLEEPRKLGNMDFSFSSVAVFFIVIWVATLLSQFTAFMLGGHKNQFGNIQKTRFGSTVLVLKLAIIIVGVMIAFAASGIPLDKITIIIGALGVGIGFGMQNIVNNLVSGVILAFEKPIEIGDQIEVGGRLGKVKEIGIRSSKLATFEGAEVIIPNGDLLSQHVVNWTLSNNKRRVEIIVGVQYGSHLELVKNILEEILLHASKVDKYPKPVVLVHQFNDSSIDFRLLFWTNIESYADLKSDIILAIDKEFKQAGIDIPFPQIVVHQAAPSTHNTGKSETGKNQPEANS